MKKILLITLLLNWQVVNAFQASKQAIPPQVKQQMLRYTWRPGCPVKLEDLAYLEVEHWGFDNKVHQGQLIVHTQVANEVMEIFAELYRQRYPIEKIKLMSDYQGNDEKAMRDNNSSAFNCRTKSMDPRAYSNHSYGRAIDFNARLNPLVSGRHTYPKNSKPYRDRNQNIPGMIHENDPLYQAFDKRGWFWGGHWQNTPDYQHFEKVAN